MPRKLRQPKNREQLNPDALEWLGGNDRVAWAYLVSADELVALWRDWGDQFVADHVAEYPGTRPDRWWAHDAPEPRRRLGGIGTPQHERLATVLSVYLGVPRYWIDQSLLDCYVNLGRPLNVPAIDPKFPPLYESEPAYLHRLGILTAAERKRLTSEDFAPESIIDILGLDL
jgi:hypothetical protein